MNNVSGKATLAANARRIQIPAAALGPWLAEIGDPTELKVTLRALALLAEGASRRGTLQSAALYDLLDDPFLAQGCAGADIRRGLAAALTRGTLMAAVDRGEVRVFLNDDAGRRHLERAALRLLSPADVLGKPPESLSMQGHPEKQPAAYRTNIFALYEEHIGPYGHSIAEQLKAAEEEYPASWIEDAIAVAVERNFRSWGYISAILRRWNLEGRQEVRYEHGKFGRDTAQDSRKTNLDDYRERYGRLPWESDDRGPE